MSQTKYPKYKAAVEAVISAIKADDDKAVESAIEQLYTAQDEEMSQGASDQATTKFRRLSRLLSCPNIKARS